MIELAGARSIVASRQMTTGPQVSSLAQPAKWSLWLDRNNEVAPANDRPASFQRTLAVAVDGCDIMSRQSGMLIARWTAPFS
jgi:hypothetical protein